MIGKIPYYEGINIKSATPTRLFTSVVMPINSWKITAGEILRYYIPYYEFQIFGPVSDPTANQYLYFHGAKNTEYTLYFVNEPDFVDGSVGIPSDYKYFYGSSMYDPISLGQNATVRGFISTYFNLYSYPLIQDPSFFNNKEINIKTDNQGNFTFMLVVCGNPQHYLKMTVYFYLKGYERHKLIFSHSVHNIFG